MPARLLATSASSSAVELPPGGRPAARPAATAAGADEARGRPARRADFLRTRTGRDFTHYKRATMLRRIGRRMQVNGVDNLAGYLGCLRTRPARRRAAAGPADQRHQLLPRPRVLRALEAHPALFEGKGPNDTVRVWVVACATGEEAYSVAMLLSEHARTLEAPPLIQVFATDLDEEAIQAAREGVYPAAIEADVSARSGCAASSRRSTAATACGASCARWCCSRCTTCCGFAVLAAGPGDLPQPADLPDREAQRACSRPALRAAPQRRGCSSARRSRTKTAARCSRARQEAPHLRASGPPRAPGCRRRRPPARWRRWRCAQHAARRAGDRPAAASTAAGAAPPAGAAPGRRTARLLGRRAPAAARAAGAALGAGQREHDIVHLSPSAGPLPAVAGGEPSRNLLRAVQPGLRIELRAALYQAAQQAAWPKCAAAGGAALAGGTVQRARARDAGARHRRRDLFLVLFESSGRGERRAGGQGRAAGADPLARHLDARDRAPEGAAARDGGAVRGVDRGAQGQQRGAAGHERGAALGHRGTGDQPRGAAVDQRGAHHRQPRAQEQGRRAGPLQQRHAQPDGRDAIATIFLDRDLRITRYTPAAVRCST
jgi:two-component system CheB/CheR fusion protein